ncbi:thyroid transcription factor 1-associated protein 26 homolog [Haliotis rufescens]|uniref:thyroid transcription factor 1-associated protein 26 homolog n=1 Tax=Haliotis rufescens TaxID=6454 RepID=UPI00201F03C4|nr:thyroid transcription factor 1-associated protein 26 homolog [Haliotis rufescens]
MDKKEAKYHSHHPAGKGKSYTQYHTSKKRINPQKQFNGSKQEGEGFAEKRKKKMRYEYMKLLKKQKRQKYVESQRNITNSSGPDEVVGNVIDADMAKPRNFRVRDRHEGKQHIFSEAQKRFHEKKENQEKQKQENLLRLEEQKKAVGQYNSKRKKKHLMLCKKTHKGQPIMKHQIHYLLEKIQADIGHS